MFRFVNLPPLAVAVVTGGSFSAPLQAGAVAFGTVGFRVAQTGLVKMPTLVDGVVTRGILFLKILTPAQGQHGQNYTKQNPFFKRPHWTFVLRFTGQNLPGLVKILGVEAGQFTVNFSS